MASGSSSNRDGINRLAIKKPFGEVFQAEVAALGTSRPRPFAAGVRQDHPLEAQSTGLALSGGGIRSAAVALGVVQALAAKKAFKPIDYLSTVSGGGYTGAALIAGLWRSNGTFPFSTRSGENMEAADVADNDAVRAIRDHSRYLMPNGAFDLVVSLGILLRGLAVNAVYVAATIFLVATLALLAYPDEADLGRSLVVAAAERLRLGWAGSIESWLGTHFVATKAFLVIFLAWLLVFAVYRSVVSTVERASERLQSDPLSRPARATGYAIIGIIVVFFLESQRPIIATAVALFGDESAINATTEKVEYSFVAMVAGTGAVGLTFRFLVNALQDAQKDTSWSAFFKAALARSGLYLSAGILPTLIYGAYVWLVLIGLSKDGLFVRAQGFFTTTDRSGHVWPALIPLFLIAGFCLLQAILGPVAETFYSAAWWRQKAFQTGRFWCASAAVAVLASVAMLVVHPLLVPALEGSRFGSVAVWTYAGFTAWLSFIAVLFSENGNTLHRLYRDRLQQAFAVDRGNEADQETDQPVTSPEPLRMSDLVTTKDGWRTLKPYPVINGAINLQSSTRNRRGRNADFFVFTPHHVGSDATGYVATKEFEKAEPHIDLASAMAISGAAVSSAMGRVGVAVLAPTLSLLNIRLGFWLRNPRYAHSAEARAEASRSDWTIAYMFAEILNRLNETMRKVYVTDGGHIDNLGLHQLLKRRCEVIIVSDAEADPAMTFGALVDVERFARIDLGVRIDLPVEPLRRAALSRQVGIQRDPITGAASPPHAHAAIGTIAYPPTSGADRLPATEGVILYVKAAMTGDETNYVLDYERRNPKFPHEPTSDQFFGEEQFEAYRALGFHAMSKALDLDDGSDRTAKLRERLRHALNLPPSSNQIEETNVR